ncbi:MAG: Rpn family recombination-promoting nuclease/putative transposase [Microscillaceae bacterium]|nr:Rpn family recombination-promoting nuclease/putative transposase [Microscillaceae bacterium]
MSKKLIRFDWAIRRLLRNKANFVILEGFLSELLFEDIKIHKVLESEGNQEDAYDKFNRVDLLVENSQGELLIIEVQNNDELDYFHRILYGTSKLITEYLDLGEAYEQLKKVISVNIVYFDLGQGEDYLYRGQTSFLGMHTHDLLHLSTKQQEYFKKESIESIFPEYYLIKANNFDDVAKDTLDEWIYFFKNSEVKDEFKAKGIQKAKETLDTMKLSKEEQKNYKRYLENLSYQKSMMNTAKFEGELAAKEVEEEIRESERKNTQIQIAKNGLEKGYPLEMIADMTGLNLEEIEKIQQEIKIKK